MARTRTLAQLRTDVCDRADVTDGGATGRHPSSRLNRYINQALQRYYDIVTGAGGTDWYMKRTGVATMSTSTVRDAAGWAPQMYIPCPTDFYQLVGVDVIVGGQAYSLMPYERAERNMFRDTPWLNSANSGQPVFYRIGGSTASGTKTIQLLPFSNSNYQYEVFYYPEFSDLSSDSDTFDGHAGFEEYVVNQAAINILMNNGAVDTPLYAALTKDRDEMESEMKFKFATMAGPGRRMDTEQERMRLSRFARGDWWGR